MLQVRDDLKPEAMGNIKRAQDYQKEYYDKRHAHQVFLLEHGSIALSPFPLMLEHST